MDKTQNPIIDQTVVEEKPAISVNWKKVAKYAAIIGTAVGIGIILHATRDSDGDESTTDEITNIEE